MDPPPPLLLVRKPPVFSGTRSLYSPFLPSPPPPLFLFASLSLSRPSHERYSLYEKFDIRSVGAIVLHQALEIIMHHHSFLRSFSRCHSTIPRAHTILSPPPSPVICLFVFFIEINTSFSALVRFPLNPIITILYLLTERRRIVCIYLRLRNWIIELTVFIYDLVYRNDTSKKNVLSYDKIRRRKWCRGIVKS